MSSQKPMLMRLHFGIRKGGTPPVSIENLYRNDILITGYASCACWSQHLHALSSLNVLPQASRFRRRELVLG